MLADSVQEGRSLTQRLLIHGIHYLQPFVGMLVPFGSSGGAGMFNGFHIPSFVGTSVATNNHFYLNTNDSHQNHSGQIRISLGFF